jgi:putative transposase
VSCPSHSVRTGRPARLKAFDYVGYHRYFLTFCTNERRLVFIAPEPVACVLTQFRRAATAYGVALSAYCFMPDHVHLLAEGTHVNADGRTFISRAKQLSGFHFAKAFGHRLWQHYGYEHVLRAQEDTLGVARYLLANPIRAGLCDDVREYPYVGSDVYSIVEIAEAVQMAKPG